MAPSGDGLSLVPAGAFPPMPPPEDWGAEPGGGPEALAVMVNMLGMDLERTQEGLGRLVTEADEVLQGVFERLGILHARVSRIESACGMPPWRPPGEEEDEEEEGREAEPMSARTDGSGGPGLGRPEEAPSPHARRRPGGRRRGRRCGRGHPLEEDAECPEGAPPRLCSFCKTMKETTHRCSAGCYFHACAECVMGTCGNDDACCPDPEAGEPQEPQDQPSGPANAAVAAVPSAAVGLPGKSRFSSRSPSNASEEDVSFCVNFLTPAATPSTTLPDDEAEATCQELPSFAEDSPPELGRRAAASPPRAERPPRPPTPASEARGAAEGSAAKGMKARLCDLEEEVKELSRRLATSRNEAPAPESKVVVDEDCRGHVLGSSEALQAEVRAQAEALMNATREECQDVMAHLAEELQSEVHAMADPKRVLALLKRLEDGDSDSAVSRKDQRHCAGFGLEQDTSLTQQVEKLAASCHESSREQARTCGELRNAFDILQQDLAGNMEGLRGEIEKLKAGAAEVSSASLSSRTSGLGRSASSVGGKPPLLSDELSQGRVRPRTASLAAGKIRRSASKECLEGDGSQADCVRGLVQALMAIARVVGLMRDEGEKLGEGEWEWGKVGRRLEQAWASRTKDLWQIGVKPPTVVDLIRSKGDGGPTRGLAATLPDRRESARLAERLASTLNAANCTSSTFFNGSDSPSATLRHLSQYTSPSPQDKQGLRHGATAPAAGQGGRAFAGLEALRQMRRQR